MPPHNLFPANVQSCLRPVTRVARPKAVSQRCFASVSPVTSVGRSHKVVVVGAGSGGLSVAHRLLNSGRFQQSDIAVIDPSAFHHYQPGWTLVGAGQKRKEDLKRSTESLVDPKLGFYSQHVQDFTPEDNFVTLQDGTKLHYEQLVVAPGIKVDFSSIPGLAESLADSKSGVVSTYSYETCDKVWPVVQKLRKGQAIFTFPSGPVKCAGAPQKMMWLAWDHWQKNGSYVANQPDKSDIAISYASALPAMFAVPKYAKTLEQLRVDRGIEGLFQHDLVSVDGNTATFARLDSGEKVQKRFDLLHAVPRMGPHSFIKNSQLANAAGFADVNESTTQHIKYANVWSLGDASSLPTSKTAAAITGQGPVLVANLLAAMDKKDIISSYGGYTSCPLLTGENKVLLAEFKYGGVPDESFKRWLGVDQAVPRRAFYHLKKDFFPWVYFKSMVKGTWEGRNGWSR